MVDLNQMTHQITTGYSLQSLVAVIHGTPRSATAKDLRIIASVGIFVHEKNASLIAQGHVKKNE